MDAKAAMTGSQLPVSADDIAISVNNLQMQYGDTVVLKNVTFSAKRGEVIVLLGPNGAGKTTTVEVLEGFRTPSAGDITVLGIVPMKGDETWRAKLGIVLQSWRDHSRWGVRELLDHFGTYYLAYATDERPRPLKTDDLIQLVGLEAQANKPLATPSGGQRRRMDVAIGLIGNPEILFLDEPTVGFDPKARRDFHEVIHRLSDMDNTTILLTAHDLDEAEKLADRILILADGRIVADGSADKLAKLKSSALGRTDDHPVDPLRAAKIPVIAAATIFRDNPEASPMRCNPGTFVSRLLLLGATCIPLIFASGATNKASWLTTPGQTSLIFNKNSPISFVTWAGKIAAMFASWSVLTVLVRGRLSSLTVNTAGRHPL